MATQHNNTRRQLMKLGALSIACTASGAGATVLAASTVDLDHELLGLCQDCHSIRRAYDEQAEVANALCDEHDLWREAHPEPQRPKAPEAPDPIVTEHDDGSFSMRFYRVQRDHSALAEYEADLAEWRADNDATYSKASAAEGLLEQLFDQYCDLSNRIFAMPAHSTRGVRAKIKVYEIDLELVGEAGRDGLLRTFVASILADVERIGGLA